MAAAGPNGAQPGATGSSCRLEFAVQMRCQSCADAVRALLQGAPGVRLLELRLEEQTVLVETTGGAGGVQELLEKSGRRAVLKGMGGAQEGCGGAAVASLWGGGGAGGGQGLVRFLQLPPPRGCLLEGAVGGLPPGPHRLQLHQFGDLSQPPQSCGGLYDPEGPQNQRRPLGVLGTLWVDAEGGGSFRWEVEGLKVQDIIGRSVLVAAGEDSGPGLLWGVVARAAGLFQNPKRVCSCDGRSLWEERDLAVATNRPPVATNPPAATTSPTVATNPTVATTSPTVATNPTVATTSPKVATNPTAATTSPTVATNPMVATTSPTVATNPTVATTSPKVATSPTATTTNPTVATNPAVATTNPTVATNPSVATTSPTVATSPMAVPSPHL